MTEDNQPEDLRAACCEGKHRFCRPQDARRVAAKAKCRVEVYRCRYCGGWHIGG